MQWHLIAVLGSRRPGVAGSFEKCDDHWGHTFKIGDGQWHTDNTDTQILKQTGHPEYGSNI